MFQNYDLIINKVNNSNILLSTLLQDTLNYFKDNNLVHDISSITHETKKRIVIGSPNDEVEEVNTNFCVWIEEELKGYAVNNNIQSLILRYNYVDKYRHIDYIVTHRLGFVLEKGVMPLLNSVIEIERHLRNNQNIEYFNHGAPWIDIDSTPQLVPYKLIFKPLHLQIALRNIRVEFKNRIDKINYLFKGETNFSLTFDQINEIKRLIQKGELRNALLSLKNKVPSLEGKILFFSSKLSLIENKFNQGVIKLEDYQLEVNKIMFSIITLIEELISVSGDSSKTLG